MTRLTTHLFLSSAHMPEHFFMIRMHPFIEVADCGWGRSHAPLREIVVKSGRQVSIEKKGISQGGHSWSKSEEDR